MNASRNQSGKSITRFIRPLATGVLCISAAQLFAANNTWTGAGGLTWDVGTTASWTSPTTWTNADTAIFGGAGTGTINVGSGVSAGTVQVNANGYVFSGTAPTVTSLILNNGSLTEFQSGLNFAASGGLNGSTAVGGSTINFTGGTLAMAGGMNFGNGGSTTSVLTGNFTNAANFTQSSGTFTIGYNAPTTLNYNSSGTSSANAMVIGRQNGSSTFKQEQGTINVAVNADFAVQVGGNSSGSGTLDIQGGTFNVNGGANSRVIVNNGGTTNSGTLTIAGGTLTTRALFLNPGAGGTATVAVSAGTLNVDTLTTSATGTKSITLSGGTVGTNTSTSATWAPNMSLAGNVSFRAATAAGASANITLSGILSGEGGFTKIGAGTLTLSGANTYGGDTTVNAGTLATAATGTFGSGDIRLNAGTAMILGNNMSIADTASVVFDSTMGTGADINLNFTAGLDETIYSLSSISGATVAAGTYTAAQLNAAFNTDAFTGAGSLTVLAAIPEPSTYTMIVGAAVLAGACLRRRRAIAKAV
jgi:autotransporter-associated beta strand protein